jgi:hypothetical protein
VPGRTGILKLLGRRHEPRRARFVDPTQEFDLKSLEALVIPIGLPPRQVTVLQRELLESTVLVDRVREAAAAIRLELGLLGHYPGAAPFQIERINLPLNVLNVLPEPARLHGVALSDLI